MIRRVGCLAVSVIVALSAMPFASAQQPGGTLGSGGHGTVDASGSSTATGGQVVVGSSGPGERGVGAGDDPCDHWVGPLELVEALFGSMLPPGSSDAGDGDGADPVDGEEPAIVIEPPWVVVQCPTSFGGGPILDIFQLGDPPPGGGMLEAAQRALRIPLPEATFSPASEDFQVVGIETWVWMEAEATAPLTATACIPPDAYACATVVAVFDTVTADMGDGSDVVDCGGAGLAYDPGVAWEAQLDADNCGHVYIEPSDETDFAVTVTAMWSLTWSCAYDADLDGVREASCGGGAIGVVGRVAAPVPLEVREYQAVATIGG